jgi:hypothetical protein
VSGLVLIVLQLVHTRMFTLAAIDWNSMEGNNFYAGDEAQDRLRVLRLRIIG